jgi:hypothetical protein
MPVVLLAIDEVPLTAAAIKWTINTVVKPGDTLFIASCAVPKIPIGRSTDNFNGIRKQAAKELEIRLRAITQIIQMETKRNDFTLEVEMELSKLDQSDHVVSLCSKLEPKKVILFLSDESQPWLARMLNGNLATVISAQIAIKPTILTADLVRKLEDNDIWNVGVMT